ncbi:MULTISPECIES: DUF1176 domain-containing protein [unclassified Symbiopectobacterium]|uniref:DUF1176 domain-containing protein n=1 Tax=unclassified Symbiopectobacterium TaxID=2794573 RepID=UPI0022271FCA|nr:MULTISPECIES: DUF1176 domain-containing protein [unclassified Symbiopectobacterium]MCW2475596.1 DUF1176 domain-containing protein [Candidatus Symbiopectobacterium sp. NZEC151]MCW2482921.1 DUF1176 domain-containing protein [Candidatus Symbiopectobacterium sp. NZEC135]
MDAAYRLRATSRQGLSAGLFFALFLTIFSAVANYDSVYFTHKEWDLVCDNTLTCRVSGYSPDSVTFGVSVLLTRKAGAGTPVDNQVMLSDGLGHDDVLAMRGTPQLIIAGRVLGVLQVADRKKISWRMNATQYAAFLRALRRDKPIVFKDKLAEYPLSNAGSSAVMLQMDRVQGRMGTRGAIYKTGKKDDSNVKAPIAAPVIIKAPVKDQAARDMTAQELARFKPALMKTLVGDDAFDCTDDQLNSDHLPWQIARLNKTQSLVIAPCWMAAYNGGSKFWLVDTLMKRPAQLIDVGMMANDYQNGAIVWIMRGRSVGDCWSTKSWQWNGKAFVYSAKSWTGRCRYIRNGGAWDIPMRVSTFK